MSSLNKPRPDYPIYPSTGYYRKQSKVFKRPKGRRGRKPKGKRSGNSVSYQDPNFLIIKARDEARKARELAVNRVQEEKEEKKENVAIQREQLRLSARGLDDNARYRVAELTQRANQAQATDRQATAQLRQQNTDNFRIFGELRRLGDNQERRNGENLEIMKEVIRSHNRRGDLNFQDIRAQEQTDLSLFSPGQGFAAEQRRDSRTPIHSLALSPLAEVTPDTFLIGRSDWLKGDESDSILSPEVSKLVEKKLARSWSSREPQPQPEPELEPELEPQGLRVRQDDLDIFGSKVGRGEAQEVGVPLFEKPPKVSGTPKGGGTPKARVKVKVKVKKDKEKIEELQEGLLQGTEATEGALLQEATPFEQLQAYRKPKQSSLYKESTKGTKKPDHPLNTGTETYEQGKKFVITDTGGHLKSAVKGKRYVAYSLPGSESKGARAKSIGYTAHTEGEPIISGEREFGDIQETRLQGLLERKELKLDISDDE